MPGTMEQIGNISGSLSPVESIAGTLSPTSTLQGELTIPETQYEPYELPPATTGTLGGIIVGEDLLITEEGVLSIDKATSVEGDNTRPITAAAVYTEVGNINALLATI